MVVFGRAVVSDGFDMLKGPSTMFAPIIVAKSRL
jgi:hypothetical protein